mmetsp:Transcript_51806/g.116653  ORF Transcript_51806/g.116653 Transcript_51806/m.116653 type:complete len:356 (+) Transcript_51806:309-1376(+)
MTTALASPMTAVDMGFAPGTGSTETTFTRRFRPVDTGVTVETSINFGCFFTTGAVLSLSAAVPLRHLPPARRAACSRGAIQAPLRRADATKAPSTSCVCRAILGQWSFSSPPVTISENFSTRRVCCAGHLMRSALITSLGKVSPFSPQDPFVTVKPASSLLFGMTKSGRSTVHFSPTISAHCLQGCLKEQSKVAVRPSENLMVATHRRGTPSAVSSRKWQLTSVGSAKPKAQVVKRMQYQPRSPRQPKGSVSRFMRMLFFAQSSSSPNGREKALATCFVLPNISPSSRTFCMAARRSWCMNIVLSMNWTPAAVHASIIVRVSRRFPASGLSHSTCFFFAAALRTHWLFIDVGRGM